MDTACLPSLRCSNRELLELVLKAQEEFRSGQEEIKGNVQALAKGQNRIERIAGEIVETGARQDSAVRHLPGFLPNRELTRGERPGWVAAPSREAAALSLPLLCAACPHMVARRALHAAKLNRLLVGLRGGLQRAPR